MLYVDFMDRARKICIGVDEITGLFFLIPEYKYLLHQSQLECDEIEDMSTSMEDVREFLELEVERLNTYRKNSYLVSDWILNIITNKIDPLEQDATNKIVGDLIEYAKLTKELETKKTQLDDSQLKSKINQSNSIQEVFSKKEIE